MGVSLKVVYWQERRSLRLLVYLLFIRECDHHISHPDTTFSAGTDHAGPMAEADTTAAAGLPPTGLVSSTTIAATAATPAAAGNSGRSAAGCSRRGGASPETTEQYQSRHLVWGVDAIATTSSSSRAV